MHKVHSKGARSRRQIFDKTRPTHGETNPMTRKKIALWIAVAAAGVAAILFFAIRHWRPRWTIVQGAVIRRDQDTRKELPIAGVLVTASYGNERISAQSEASGYFRIVFPGTVLPGQTVHLSFRHPDYQPLDLPVMIRFRSSLRQLVIAPMTPNAAHAESNSDGPASVVSNIRVRYTVNTPADENVGSAVKTFQVVNRGNVPCRHQSPCSPDGYWKAATASVELDAGLGNQFRDARASCIAGPCPFTQIDPSGLANGSRTMTVSATSWSGTATFLVEAEVFHTSIVANVRESYPVVFDRALNFTIPSSAEGVSLEAELDGNEMVFPLGPDLYLSWANCSARPGSDSGKSTVYQCELKPGYRF